MSTPSQPHPFKVSDKLVCVDDCPGLQRHEYTHYVKRGVVYVVREARVTEHGAGVLLVGVYNPIKRGFFAHRFRLLSEVQAENAAKRASGNLDRAMEQADRANAPFSPPGCEGYPPPAAPYDDGYPKCDPTDSALDSEGDL